MHSELPQNMLEGEDYERWLFEVQRVEWEAEEARLRKVEQEWVAGYKIGMTHKCHDPECMSHVQRAIEDIGCTDLPPSIKTFWEGYLDGVCDRFDHPDKQWLQGIPKNAA